MELGKIRNTIVKLLHEHTKRPVVMINQIADKPLKENKSGIDYPFLSYDFISSFIKDKEMGVEIREVVPSTNSGFDSDIIDTLILQPQITMSFTAYATDSISAKELAQKAWDYFKHTGYYELSKNKIVVVECMNIQNRDVFEVDVYERRSGFDVRFRLVHQIDRRLETIETYTVNKGE